MQTGMRVEDDFRELIDRVLGGQGVSAIAAARAAGLNRDAIRSVQRGRSPSLGRVAEICNALGLELYIGPARNEEVSGEDVVGAQVEAGLDALPTPPPLRSFSSSVELPVRDWANCSSEGHLSQMDDPDRAPAPVGLADPQAFYARAPGHSMIPAGIWFGDYCLVSPCAQLGQGQRVWLRNRQGHEAIKWLTQLKATTYRMFAWSPPDGNGRQALIVERWTREDIVDRGVVLAVYRGRPAVGRPPFRVPDWRPDRIADLWRTALVDFDGTDPDAALLEKLESAVSAVDEAARKIRAQIDHGGLSESQLEDALRTMEAAEVVQQSIGLVSAVTGGNDPRSGKASDPAPSGYVSYEQAVLEGAENPPDAKAPAPSKAVAAVRTLS